MHLGESFSRRHVALPRMTTAASRMACTCRSAADTHTSSSYLQVLQLAHAPQSRGQDSAQLVVAEVAVRASRRREAKKLNELRVPDSSAVLFAAAASDRLNQRSLVCCAKQVKGTDQLRAMRRVTGDSSRQREGQRSGGLCRMSDPMRGHWSVSGHASWHARMHAYRKVSSSRPESEGGMPFTSRLPLRFLQCSPAGAALQNDENISRIYALAATSAEEQGYSTSHTFCPGATQSTGDWSLDQTSMN